MLKETSTHKPGKHSNKEVKALKQGLDFRDAKYRREVFLNFYEFHLKYKSHPGAVYYMMPYISQHLNFTQEDKLWFAYINGCTQNILTTYVIYQNFPDLYNIDFEKLNVWFNYNWENLAWDMDRRYAKAKFITCVEDYLKHLDGKTQVEFFNSLGNSKDKFKNFKSTWDYVINKFYLFGRLSTFSYLEYLRIMGVNLDCDELFLYDMDGSKSHRNGLCKVLGRDDLDWHDKLNPEFEGYTSEIIDWLIKEGETLLNESKQRFKDKPYIQDVSYFTLESTLCCYKSWFRKNRRYANVYNDMFYNRIKFAESKWKGEYDFSIFWDGRKKYLPQNLRLEDNPTDPGLTPEKQNHFRNTGEVIMMDKDFPHFKNSFTRNNLEDFL